MLASFSEHVSQSPWYLLTTEGLLLILVLWFVAFFFFPALRHGYRLGKLIDQFKSKKLKEFNPDQLDAAFRDFDKTDHIQHLWREHKKTLYTTTDDKAGLATVTWHATTPAESLWNGALVVDGRLKTDFFKHFPGIFKRLIKSSLP